MGMVQKGGIREPVRAAAAVRSRFDPVVAIRESRGRGLAD